MATKYFRLPNIANNVGIGQYRCAGPFVYFEPDTKIGDKTDVKNYVGEREVFFVRDRGV